MTLSASEKLDAVRDLLTERPALAAWILECPEESLPELVEIARQVLRQASSE